MREKDKMFEQDHGIVFRPLIQVDDACTRELQHVASICMEGNYVPDVCLCQMRAAGIDKLNALTLDRQNLTWLGVVFVRFSMSCCHHYRLSPGFSFYDLFTCPVRLLCT